MKNILLLSSVFVIMGADLAIGCSRDRYGNEWGESTATTTNRDVIVRDLVVTPNSLFGIEIPRQSSGSLSGAGSSSSHGNEFESEESEDDSLEGSLDGEAVKPFVPPLQLDTKKELSFDSISALTRQRLLERKKLQSYREGEYGERLRVISPRKSFAEIRLEEKEAAELELELKTIAPDPKNPRFRELFLDSDMDHGLNLEAINKRRMLVRGGAGVDDGGDDFSNSLALVQTFFGTIAREEEEVEKLKDALAKMKKQDVAALREEVKSDIAKEKHSLMAHQAKEIILTRSVNALKLLRTGGDLSEGTITGLKSAQAALEELSDEVADVNKRIEGLQKWLQEIREPEDIALELKRTKRRLSSFKIQKDLTLKKLAIATGVSLSKLRKLPPIAPERRSPATAHWD